MTACFSSILLNNLLEQQLSVEGGHPFELELSFETFLSCSKEFLSIGAKEISDL